MAGDGQRATLGSAADLLTGFPFKSAEFSEEPSDIRLLRGDNVAQGVLRWDGAKRWPASKAADHQEYLLRAGDVVLAMDRPWIEAGLKHATLTEADCPSLLVQRVACLRARSGLDQRFLGYVIRSADFTNYILGVQTGTAVPHISGAQIKAYEFFLPSIAHQERAANLLSALDDKIELNRRMAETLEGMARAIFKSWFVDFDPVRAKAEGRPTGLPDDLAALFPDGFEDDGVPSGWKLMPLSSVGEFLNGLALQKFPADKVEESLPVIKIAEMRSGPTAKSARASLKVPTEFRVDDGDHLFSWSGSLTHCRWTHGPGALNQHLFKVTPRSVPGWLLYEAVEHHLPEFQRIASGKAVTMGHIQRHHLDEALVAVPPVACFHALDSVLSPIHERSFRLALQSRILATLRDTLLPKLISGELRIADAERRIAAA